MEREITKMIRVYGIVQGVGFRPTVSRHAMARGIRGSVSNKGPYVEIFAQGKEGDVDGFISDIEERRSLDSLILLKARKRKARFLSLRILRSVMSVKRRCSIRRTGGICILLSTVPAAGRG